MQKNRIDILVTAPVEATTCRAIAFPSTINADEGDIQRYRYTTR